MDILKKLQFKSLSMSEIKDALGGKVRVITYDKLKNYKTIDEALGPYGKLVILYLTSDDYGHFVCIWKFNKEIIQFFDSYGDMVDRQLKYIPKYFIKESGQSFPMLSLLLLKSNYEVRYNSFKLQQDKTTTCGRWCVYRLIKCNLNEYEFYDIFKNNKLKPDLLITYLTKNIE
jgi:hypothetical protein